MTKKELVEFLKENFRNETGEVDLSGLDFGDSDIDLSEIKAKSISNFKQEAEKIYNSRQKAELNIYNDHQKSENVSNYSQIAGNNIFNYNQEAYGTIDNEKQTADLINNEYQTAEKIFN